MAQREWSGFEIAVIGVAGRFPGARDIASLWRNLVEGVESIRLVPLDELIARGRSAAVVRAEGFIPAHGVVDDFDRFDADFFGYRGVEADVLDPQHRIFLEVAWEALEDAGYDPGRFRGPIGVFAGSSADHYLYDNVRRNAAALSRVGAFQAGYSNLMDHLATRASYKLGLTGPSFAIQSACSTSLVAVHVACQQLLTGACDLALAGGVSLTLPAEWGYQYQDGMIHSPDGHCRAFDADAQGCLKGDGAGVVVLKRLSDALADGDHIEAIILGSAVNNDGSDKVGYTAPGLDGQIRVIEAAQAVAGVSADSIGYVEAHGTGTRLGDPIEVSALSRVFRAATQARQFCGLGSIKTNFGHLDAAAGIAGFIKVILALRHGMLPPSLHFRRPNPSIDFAASPFYVVDRATPWNTAASPRRAAVSSFGIGGTNAHVVVEEPPARRATAAATSPQVLVLSARSPRSLEEATQRLASHLALHDDLELPDVAHTLQVGRKAFAQRRCVVATTREQAIAALRDRATWIDGTPGTHAPQVVFLFPGQGAQYVGMTQGLYAGDATFRAHLDECAAIVEPLLGCDLRDVLYPGPGADTAARDEALRQTAVAQPALFIVEYALARWLIGRGVEPAAMIGHSVGELVAACLAEVFSLEDALALVVARGRLMQAQPPGEMIAVPLAAELLAASLPDGLSIAADNAPSLCVVAGAQDAVAHLRARLASEQGIECRTLHTSHAFHSHSMQGAVEPFVDQFRSIRTAAPRRRYVSTVTGTWIDAATAQDPRHWARNIRDTVQFSRAVRTALDLGDVLFLEVGPGATLTSLARRHDHATAVRTITTVRPPGESVDDATHLQRALGRLWTLGVDVHWRDGGEARHRRVSLPTYPFERERHWIEPDRAIEREDRTRKAPEDGFYLPSWTRTGIAETKPRRDERWLIIASTRTHAEPLVRTLASLVDDVDVWVSHAQGEALDERIGEATQSGRMPRRIVFLAPCEGADDGGFHALLRLCRGLATGATDAPVSLTVVTEGAWSVLGTETVRPERALPLGIAQVFDTETENVRCRTIDVESSRADWSREVAEEACSDSLDRVVAYRNGQRWRRAVEPIRLAPPPGAPALLRPRGVYLVTGGLGGMGFELACYLAQAVQAKVVLTGRSAFPPREAWDAWLSAHGADDPTARRIERIRKVESTGARVMVARADVADRAAVARLRAQIVAEWGPLNGVVHAAGVPGGHAIALLDDAHADEVLAAKVAGTRALYECLRSDGLDFMVLCSSLTSVVPRAGRADYTAANLFLDAFAHSVRDTRVIALNWDNWTEAGMAHEAAAGAPIEGLSNEEGVAAFARALSYRGPQLFISLRDLTAQPQPVRTPETAGSNVPSFEPEGPSGAASRPDLATPYDAPRNPVEATLASIWQDLLGIAQVGVNDNFFALGGDSVVSIQFVARARRAGIGVAVKQVFEHPTIAALAAVASSPQPASSPVARAALPAALPLSPMQQWFLERSIERRNHWNLAAVFEAPLHADLGVVRSVVEGVLRGHDAFGIRIAASGASQAMVEGPALAVDVVDLRSAGSDEIDATSDRVRAAMQTSLDIASGPMVRATYLDLGPGRAGRLLLVAHHLVADIVSMRVLADDFNEAHARARAGAAHATSSSATSFGAWVQRLVAFAASADLAAELPYWTAQAALPAAALARDDPAARNSVESTATLTVNLDVETTRMLAGTDASGSARAVLAALLGTLAWTLADGEGTAPVWVDVEGHGRDAFADDVDVSRTVGWFTALYPVPLARGADLHDTVARTSAQLAGTPRGGFGFGVLRYLHPDASVRARLAATPRPEVVLLYQGQTGRVAHASGDFGLVEVDAEGGRAGSELRTHLIEVDARIDGGALRMSWAFSRVVHRRESIERLAREVERSLRELATSRRPPLAQAQPAEEPPANAAPRTAPLSFAQERIWFLQQLAPQSTLYNKQAVLEIRGELDPAALERAFAALVKRHESLRTRVGVVDGVPVQIVEPPARVALPAVGLEHAADRDIAAQWAAMVAEPFDLEAAPPLRLRLLRRGPREHWLGITFHHIITDAWSAQVFVRELGALYTAQSAGVGAPSLAPLPITLADFAERQRAAATTSALAGHLAFWTDALRGVQPLELPTDRLRPALQRFEGGRVQLNWPAALLSDLRALARARGASLFMVLLTLFDVLLQRYTSQDDIAVGVPAADRPDIDTENLIGPLVNNLVMRTDLGGNPSFTELLARVRDTVLAANEHRDLPFEKLVEALHPVRDRSRTPIFQVMFAFMNVPAAPRTWDRLDVRLIEPDHGTAEFDLALYAYDPGVDGELRGWIEYSAALFDAATVERMSAHLQRLAAAVAANPECAIGAIDLLGDVERRRMLVEWNRTEVEHPRDTCLHALFEQQVDRGPARLAARFDDGTTLTYDELDRRANRLARHLRVLGVRADARVAICVDRSSAMLVGMLGILKAGGAYVPLDPAYPKDRIAYMLGDCEARIVVTQAQFRDLVAGPQLTCVCLDADWPDILSRADERIDEGITPGALAYVIYTSGSTGNPKGVQIEHRAVVNFLHAMRARPGIGEHDRLLAVTTMSFDIHVLELFLPLAVGATVVVASRETTADATALIEHLATFDITIMQATPSTWRMLLDAGWAGRRAQKCLCGGEALPADVARGLLDRCGSLWNMYGPTEATVWACVEEIVDADAPITIGRPFDNVRCYVLDARGAPVPIGVPGELCIGGDCLARGYLNRPELTAERFPPDPFVPGSRIYRTGDMARFLSDGRIVVLGRLDGQVKLRGHRVELGEVEAVLGAHPAVAQCAAALREDQPGDQRLVAYAVAAAGVERPDHRSLRNFAAGRLPDYMLPAALVWLDELPLTPNGKIDRRKLPAPAPVVAVDDAHAEQLSPAEKLFGDIFADVLGVDAAGRYDNFFDLGGHSLLAMRVVDRFRKATGLRMQPGELFQQTIGQLAAHYAPLIADAQGAAESGASPRFGGAVKSLIRRVVGK